MRARTRSAAVGADDTGTREGARRGGQSASAAVVPTTLLDTVRAAIVTELGAEPVRCRTCAEFFRRSPALEPWQAATDCADCSARIAQAERGRPVNADRRWEREPRRGKRVEIVRSERL